MTPAEILAMLVARAVEAGADPVRADERMRQAAQVVAVEIDLARQHGRGCSCGEDGDGG